MRLTREECQPKKGGLNVKTTNTLRQKNTRRRINEGRTISFTMKGIKKMNFTGSLFFLIYNLSNSVSH